MYFIPEFTFERQFGVSVRIMGRNKDSSYKLLSHSSHNRTRTLKCTVKVLLDIHESFGAIWQSWNKLYSAKPCLLECQKDNFKITQDNCIFYYVKALPPSKNFATYIYIHTYIHTYIHGFYEHIQNKLWLFNSN